MEQEVINKNSIPEPSDLFLTPTTPQHLTFIRIEDYLLKESSEGLGLFFR